jgi:hypothetical protein
MPPAWLTTGMTLFTRGFLLLSSISFSSTLIERKLHEEAIERGQKH